MRTKNHPRRRPCSSRLSSSSLFFSLSTRPRNFVPRRKNPDETRALTKGRKKGLDGFHRFLIERHRLTPVLSVVVVGVMFWSSVSTHRGFHSYSFIILRVSFEHARGEFRSQIVLFPLRRKRFFLKQKNSRGQKHHFYLLLFEKEHTRREREICSSFFWTQTKRGFTLKELLSTDERVAWCSILCRVFDFLQKVDTRY